MIRPLALLVCAFSIVLLPQVASAKPKVALTEIEGDKGGDIHAAVIEALEGKELSLLSGKDVNRAAAKIGDVAAFTEKDLKKLATQLEADAIVLGKLDKAGASRTLKFRLFINQKMAKGFTVSFKDARSAKFRTLLHDKMIEKLGATDGADGAAEDDPADAGDGEPAAVATTSGAKAGGDEAKPAKGDATPPAKAGKQVATADKAGADKVGVEAGVSTGVERPRSANLIPIRLDVGMSAVKRSLAFDTSVAGNPADPTLSVGPGVRVGVEAYPLALTDPASPLARLGLAVEYDRTLKLDVSTMAQKAPVSQSQFSIGVRYRHAFGATELSPTLTLGVGYGKREFAPDTAAIAGDAAKGEVAKASPSSDFSVVDPGVSFRYPVSPRFAAFAGARGLLFLSAGPIQENTSYGAATAYGVDVDLGVDIVLGKRFAVRIAGEVTQVGYSFDGSGALTDVNGSAATQEVSGLTDRSLGGSATLGVLY